MHSTENMVEFPPEASARIAAQIKEIADVETIVECLGLETQRVGRRTSILCPDHNDKHFKSCYLTEHGYRCFSCGKRGDEIQLVQSVKNCSFAEACLYIADIYDIKLDIDIQNDIPRKKVLNSKSLALIGLARDKSAERIYVDLHPIDPIDFDDEMGSEFRMRWEPVDCDADNPFTKPSNAAGFYVLQRLACKNPLQALLEEDEAAYNDLICRKAIEAAEKYAEMIEMAINPARFYQDENMEKFLMAYYCAQIAEHVGIGTWKAEMEKRIRECDNIRIEFSSPNEPAISSEPENPKPKPKRKRTSVFGQAKTGGASL